MHEVALLLIEDSLSESTLARVALTLHVPGVEVIGVRDARAAAAAIARAHRPVALAILGREALRQELALPVPAVAIAAGLSESEKRRARAAGIAVYERPFGWQAYSALVERVLAERLPTRTG